MLYLKFIDHLFGQLTKTDQNVFHIVFNLQNFSNSCIIELVIPSCHFYYFILLFCPLLTSDCSIAIVAAEVFFLLNPVYFIGVVMLFQYV